MKKSPLKSVGSLKLEPLKNRFFDMKPSAMGKRGLTLSWMRSYHIFAIVSALVFLGVMMIYALIAGQTIARDSQALANIAYDDFKEGIKLLPQDPEAAAQAFDQAQKSFESLQQNTAFLTGQANRLTDEALYLDTADTLVKAALNITDLGQRLVGLVQSVQTFQKEVLSLPPEQMMERLHEKEAELKGLLSLGSHIQQQLTTVNFKLLPENYQADLRQAQEQMGVFLSVLLEVDQHFQTLFTLLGDSVPHRYLILFQNNHEIRGTGGFIGSYVVMDVNDGKITKMDTRDIYEADGQMKAEIPAPPGINQLAPHLYMRDANYSPDFPSSAQDLMWFLEHSKGPSVDTVIAIDQTLIEEILRITGPLSSSTFPITLDAENFNRVLSFYTEAKLSDTNTPKQLLFDLIPHFKSKLTELDGLTQLLPILKAMAEQGHLQVYSKDEAIENLSQNLGVSGAFILPSKKTDFLSIISTSIGGNKTDEFIDSQFRHETLVQENGKMIDELSVTKAHTYSQSIREEIDALVQRYGTGKMESRPLYNILGEGENVDYMRVYVPLGSKLQAASGVKMQEIDVSEDLGYTVFGFTFGRIAPGKEKTVRLRYELPYKLSVSPGDNYRFVAQKQAGAEDLHLTKYFKAADGLSIRKTYPEFTSPSLFSPVLDLPFEKNQFFIAAIAKN